MKTLPILLALTLFSALSTAYAEVGARPSKNDGRVQTILFPRDNVIRVAVAEGVATTIELPSKDLIKNFAMGDRQAWHAKFDGNLIVLKPAAVKPDTNLTVYTARRNYLFILQSTDRKSKSVAYWLRVQDPEENELTPEGIKAARAKADKAQVELDLRNSRYEGKLNSDYWIVGAAELQPVSMHDNGRQTYMTFNAANAIPAAFVIESDGTESLADYHMEGDTMVIHQIAHRFMLRRGALVAGITNRAPVTRAQQSPTGTSSDKVQRTIKPENQE